MKQKTTAFVRVYVNKQRLNVFLRFLNSRRVLFDASPSTMPLASVGIQQSPPLRAGCGYSAVLTARGQVLSTPDRDNVGGIGLFGAV